MGPRGTRHTVRVCGVLARARRGYVTWSAGGATLDICQFQTILCAAGAARRVRDARGASRARPVGGGRLAVHAVVRAPGHCLAEGGDADRVARLLGLTWDEARGIQERAVRRGLARRVRTPVRHLGLDEKSFLKRHQYVSVVVDLDRGCVLDVGQRTPDGGQRGAVLRGDGRRGAGRRGGQS